MTEVSEPKKSWSKTCDWNAWIDGGESFSNRNCEEVASYFYTTSCGDVYFARCPTHRAIDPLPPEMQEVSEEEWDVVAIMER